MDFFGDYANDTHDFCVNNVRMDHILPGYAYTLPVATPKKL